MTHGDEAAIFADLVADLSPAEQRVLADVLIAGLLPAQVRGVAEAVAVKCLRRRAAGGERPPWDRIGGMMADAAGRLRGRRGG